MPLREVEGTGFERVEGTNESEGLDEGTINGVVDGLYISDGWGGIRAKGGNDTLSATATNGWGYGHEIHTYAGAGDDVTYLDFGLITIFSAGHHARGGSRDAMTYGEQFNTDDPFDLDDHIIPVDAHTNSRVLSEGADTFVFQNLHNIQDVVVGRLEDLDHSQDQVYIGAVSPNNLIDFSSGSGTINGHSWRIVEWNGEHLDPNADPQQWLLIETSGGGTLLYAIEGARVDNSDIESPGDYQEHHFVSEVPTRAFLATNPQGVGFVDPVNFVPVGYLPDAGGLYLDDFDVDQADVDAEISGTNVGDVIAAGLNDDLVSANGGDDTVWGGSGSDTINGNGGNDLLFGNTGDDSLSGGDGADSIQGEEGSDTINGNGGNDLLFGNTGDDSLSGGDGADSIQGEEGSDTIYGNAGNDSLKGQQGDDAVWGENGHDTIKGGWGNDTLGGGAGNDSLYGGGDDDVIWTGAGQNYAQGDAGNDKIEGGSSSDTIYGGEGNDTLYGWGGDDTMKGGAENDILDGNGGNDYLEGEAGNDKLYGGAGDDSIWGGNGNDTLWGGDGENMVGGGAGDDAVNGGDFNDTLNGGSGADTLTGWAGDDSLTGGWGSDTFVFSWSFGHDTIVDFTDEDFLDLSAFNFATAADAYSAAYQSGANVVVEVDSTRTITLLDVSLAQNDITAADFIV